MVERKKRPVVLSLQWFVLGFDAPVRVWILNPHLVDVYVVIFGRIDWEKLSMK